MCGRYAASRKPEDLVEEFDLDDVPGGIRSAPLAPRWNVAPTDEIYAVVQRGVRSLRVMRWGLVPSWSKDRSTAGRLINARVETVAAKPAFRKAFAARRCLLPADGYFEWYVEEDGHKQPYFITPTGGAILAMAGLYEIWRDPARADDDAGAWLWTATIITTAAEDDLGRLHDRMPLLVERERYAAWLDPATPGDPRELLVPASPGRLRAYPVSTDVGNVRNDGPYLIEPLQVEPAQVEPAQVEPLQVEPLAAPIDATRDAQSALF